MCSCLKCGTGIISIVHILRVCTVKDLQYPFVGKKNLPQSQELSWSLCGSNLTPAQILTREENIHVADNLVVDDDEQTKGQKRCVLKNYVQRNSYRMESNNLVNNGIVNKSTPYLPQMSMEQQQSEQQVFDLERCQAEDEWKSLERVVLTRKMNPVLFIHHCVACGTARLPWAGGRQDDGEL